MDRYPFVLLQKRKAGKLAAYLLFGLLFTAVACTPQEPKPTNEDVAGNWKVSAAKRNNRPAITLDGTFFNFSATGTLESNLPIYEQQTVWQSSYRLADDTLFQEGSKPMKYLVKSWSDSMLVLEFTTRGIPFELELTPVGPDSSLIQ
jgi:hypothetical protein